MEGLVVRPRVNELAVMQGLPAPQTFLITDMRAGDDRKKAAEIVLELPKGMTVLNHKSETLANGYTRYVFPLKRANVNAKYSSPTIYIAAPQKVNGKAVIYARSGGVDQFKSVLPINQVVPPQLKPFKRLHISLSWMHEDSGRKWPDFFNEWGKFGFNTVSQTRTGVCRSCTESRLQDHYERLQLPRNGSRKESRTRSLLSDPRQT